MRTTFKVIAILLLLGLVSGTIVWRNMDTTPTVVIEEGKIRQALESGVGSLGIEIEGRPAWHPSTLGEVRSLLGDDSLNTAREQLAAHLTAKPQSGAAHVLQAEILRRLGQLDEALEHAELGANLLATQGRAHWIHARVLASRLAEIAKKGGKMGILRAASKVGSYRSALRTAIELDPSNVEARKEEILFYLVTPMMGDPVKGLELAQDMEKQHPMQGMLTVARALYFSDRGDEAVKLARKAVGQFPNSTEPTWILGTILYRSKRYDEADVEFEKLAAGVKDETYYQAIYTRMRLRTRQNKDAEKVLQLASEYLTASPQWEWAPPLSDVWCQKGLALQDLGRLEEARGALETSLELDPDSERAKSCLAELDKS